MVSRAAIQLITFLLQLKILEEKLLKNLMMLTAGKAGPMHSNLIIGSETTSISLTSGTPTLAISWLYQTIKLLRVYRKGSSRYAMPEDASLTKLRTMNNLIKWWRVSKRKRTVLRERWAKLHSSVCLTSICTFLASTFSSYSPTSSPSTRTTSFTLTLPSWCSALWFTDTLPSNSMDGTCIFSSFVTMATGWCSSISSSFQKAKISLWWSLSLVMVQ